MTAVKIKARVAPAYAKVSSHSGDTLPSSVRELVNGLPELLEAYYRWADLQGNFQGDSKRMLDYIDSDKTSDDMFAFIKQTFLRLFPDTSKTALRNLMKFARDFYSKRGTEESYRFLFRALFNESIDIDYPGNYLFATSDGVWVRRTIMKILYTDKVKSIVGRRIYGLTSNASALVKELSVTAVGFDLVADLVISDEVGTFEIDEIVVSRDSGESVVSRTIGSAGSVEISSRGKGYASGVIIPLLDNGDGTGFSARVGAVGDLGEILTIDVISSGSGYVYRPPVLNMASPILFDPQFDIQEEANVQVLLSGQYRESGRYSNLKSATSDVFKLQDGTYYQNFSYVIRTNVPLSEFGGVVQSLVHPAGTVLFAQPNVDANPNNILNNTGSILFHASKPEEINYNNPYTVSSRKFFDVDVYIESEVSSFADVALIRYLKYLCTYASADEVSLSDKLWDIIISKTIKYDITSTKHKVISQDQRGSRRLYELWNTELELSEPPLTLCGLSPIVTYSNITIA